MSCSSLRKTHREEFSYYVNIEEGKGGVERKNLRRDIGNLAYDESSFFSPKYEGKVHGVKMGYIEGKEVQFSHFEGSTRA